MGVNLYSSQIYNWVPDTYDDLNNLPAEMPDDLKSHIKSLPPAARKQIWVSCTGEHPLDNEKMGPIQYYPRRGFPSYYFPYQNLDGYMSPLIAVQFERPQCKIIIYNLLYKKTP